MAVVIDLADAVVARINGAALSQVFVATRSWVSVLDITDLDGIRVDVIPLTLAVTPHDLSHRHLYDWDIAIAIRRKSGRSPAEVDPLVLLGEEIVDLFLGWVLSANTRCVRIVHDPATSPDGLDTRGVFASIVTLTMRVTR